MRSLSTAALLVLVFGMAMCGGGSPSAPTPPPSGPVTINIVGDRGSQSFSPNPATAAGRSVVFRNTDTVVHRVRLNDLSIDTGDIAPGATSNPVNMPASGTNYHCALHATMVGAVGGGNTGPPPCQGIYC
jgi:plastocyanin